MKDLKIDNNYEKKEEPLFKKSTYIAKKYKLKTPYVTPKGTAVRFGRKNKYTTIIFKKQLDTTFKSGLIIKIEEANNQFRLMKSGISFINEEYNTPLSIIYAEQLSNNILEDLHKN